MKYIFIHEVSYLNKPVFEYQDFPERLSKDGHEVVVIDFVEHEATPQLDRHVSRTGLADVRLISIRHSNIPILKYFQAQWNFFWILFNLLREGRWDCIFLYSIFVNGVTAAWLAPWFKVPVVYRAIDVYHQLRPGRLAQSILKLGESFVYRRASRILSTNDKLKTYVSGMLGKSCSTEDKVFVLDHGVDVEHFSSGYKSAQLASSLGIQDGDFVIIFLGTTYSFSRLDQLLVLLAPLLRDLPYWKVLIVGAGELDTKIEDAIRDENLADQVHAVGMIDYSSLPKYLALGTVGINPFQINEITKDIIPIKNLQYLAAGLPVVSTPLPDLVRKIPADDRGIFYSPTDNLLDLVLLLKKVSHRSDVGEMKSFVRNLAGHEHGIEKAINRLVAFMNGVSI